MQRSKQSLERTLFDLIADSPNPPTLIVSMPILTEYRDVFYRRKFAFGAAADEALRIIDRLADHVTPAVEIRALKDPDDTKFVAAALDGRADYLLTRNKRDYPDWAFIVSVKEFMELEYPEVLGR